jgi:holo-[acyl-carrier protein] synthase
MRVIVGIGCDLVAVERLERAIARHPGIVERLFTPAEVAFARARRAFGATLAARLAAKEACLKALGTGLSGCRWRDVEVVARDGGRPGLRLEGGAAAAAVRLGVRRWHVSLSHVGAYALAQVVAEG